jgi:pimeloyl-ACP methyl ester carboxylesterase
MPVVEGAGVELAYEERGRGPGVLLVHGIASRAAGWRPMAESLAPHARVVAHDRRGYGGSGAPDPYDRTTVEEQSEDAAALLRRLDLGPAVIAGRDVGALIALDLAWRHRDLVRGIVVADPAVLQLSASATDVLAGERVALEEALRAGGAGLAISRFGGDPADARAIFADWAVQAGWPVLRHELRTFDVPAAVVLGGETRTHLREAGEALAALMPRAELRDDGDVVSAVVALLGGESGL